MYFYPDDAELYVGAPTETRYGELDLFTKTHACGENPQTSFDAAESMREIAAQQKRQLYNVLIYYGPLTADECDERLSWRPTTAGRRMSDLVRDGLARDTGRTRPTRSGRQATVYEAMKRSAAA